MSEELDFELIDESADQDESTTETSEETTTSEEDSKSSSEEDTSSTKSKKSNWKKMSKTIKDLRAENEALKKAKVTKTEDVDDEEEYDFDEEEGGFDKTEFRFFTIENPEAKEHQKQMESLLEKYPNMSFEDALTFVKAQTPQESTSSKDFSSKWSNVKVRKKLADLTEEEALKLPNSKYLEYQKLKGWVRR